jgi:hypothetical protein
MNSISGESANNFGLASQLEGLNQTFASEARQDTSNTFICICKLSPSAQ